MLYDVPLNIYGSSPTHFHISVALSLKIRMKTANSYLFSYLASESWLFGNFWRTEFKTQRLDRVPTTWVRLRYPCVIVIHRTVTNRLLLFVSESCRKNSDCCDDFSCRCSIFTAYCRCQWEGWTLQTGNALGILWVFDMTMQITTKIEFKLKSLVK